MSDSDEAGDGELIVDIELNEDQSKIVLIVSTPDGSPVSKHEFIMALEMYLHEVTQAEITRSASPGKPTH